MNFQETLYSTDSTGKVREWSVKTEGANVIVTHGVKGGKLQEKVTTCKAKNVGKANATTPEEQAVLEAQAKWTFQIDREDYHWDVTKANRQIRPMLALDYNKVPHRVDWNQAMAQQKLDGVRLTVGRRYIDEPSHEMMTRKGEIYVVPHLVDPTLEFMEIVNSYCDNRCLALDGEAYIHGMPLQQILSRVKKYHKGLTEQVKYYFFDLVIKDMPFSERYMILSKAFSDYIAMYDPKHEYLTPFALVPTLRLFNEDNMKSLHGSFTERGFEGLMIRHNNSEYGIGQRSPDLFKYKHFLDEEAKIIDVWEDKNGNAMLTCLQKNGKECKVTPKRTHEARKAMLENPDELIGKWITVKYQALTDDGVFQFPVGLDLRECDENGEPIE